MPALQRTGDLTLLMTAGAITLVLSIASFALAPVDPTPEVAGSSFGSHSAGSRAVYLALGAAGHRVERSYEPLAAVRRDPRSTLLILAEPALPPSDQDGRALRAFLEAGGVVVAAGPSSARFLPELRVSGRGAQARAAATPASMVSPLSGGVPVLESPRAGELAADSIYLPVFGDSAQPAVLAADIKEGSAVWIAGVHPLTNAGIAAPGSAEFLANVLAAAGQRTILWDEHYHGHTRSLWSYVVATPLPFAALQLGVVFVGGLLAFSRRRWPPRDRAVEPRHSPLEFIDSMGALYERAGTASGALATIRARARRSLVEICGVPAGLPDAQLAERASRRAGWPAERIEALLASSGRAAGNADLGSAEALRLTSELQQLVAATRSAVMVTRN